MLQQYQQIEQKLLTYPLEHGIAVPEPYAAALIREALSPRASKANPQGATLAQLLLYQLLLRTAPTLTTIQEKIQYTDLLDRFLQPLLPTLLHHCKTNTPLLPSILHTLSPTNPPSILRLILLQADLLPYLGPTASRLPSLLPAPTTIPH